MEDLEHLDKIDELLAEFGESEANMRHVVMHIETGPRARTGTSEDKSLAVRDKLLSEEGLDVDGLQMNGKIAVAWTRISMEDQTPGANRSMNYSLGFNYDDGSKIVRVDFTDGNGLSFVELSSTLLNEGGTYPAFYEAFVPKVINGMVVLGVEGDNLMVVTMEEWEKHMKNKEEYGNALNVIKRTAFGVGRKLGAMIGLDIEMEKNNASAAVPKEPQAKPMPLDEAKKAIDEMTALLARAVDGLSTEIGKFL